MEILGIIVGILMAMWIVLVGLAIVSENEEVADFSSKVGFAAMVLGGIFFVLSLIEAIFN